MDTAGRRVAIRDDKHSIPKATVWQRLFAPFWALPAAITVAALAAGVGLPLLDAGIEGRVPLAFPGGPDGARGLLGTIASAMISVTGLVFSITMVVLQLASSQFTPRVLNHFLGNRVTQVTLGVFVATFVFALTVLREVRGGFDGRSPFVPQLSVTVAYALVLASVGLFLAFIHHVTEMIRVAHVIGGLGDTTARLVARTFPEPDAEEPTGLWATSGEASAVVFDDRHGHVAQIDERRLVEWAAQHDLRVRLRIAPGAFATQGRPLAEVWGRADDAASAVNAAVELASDRSLAQDPAFGLRQLADIAERALSPGINDPTTAVQVLDELHRVLRIAVQRRDPARFVADADGVPRLEVRSPTVAGLLALALEEIAHYGSDSVQIPRRIAALLDDLEGCALGVHAAEVRRLRGVLATGDAVPNL